MAEVVLPLIPSSMDGSRERPEFRPRVVERCQQLEPLVRAVYINATCEFKIFEIRPLGIQNEMTNLALKIVNTP